MYSLKMTDNGISLAGSAGIDGHVVSAKEIASSKELQALAKAEHWHERSRALGVDARKARAEHQTPDLGPVVEDNLLLVEGNAKRLGEAYHLLVVAGSPAGEHPNIGHRSKASSSKERPSECARLERLTARRSRGAVFAGAA